MHADFEVYYGGAMGLTSCCLYGGVDIVVGTPGRIKVITVIILIYYM